MTRRGRIALGMALGGLWGIVLIWIGSTWIVVPMFLVAPAIAWAMMGPGLVLILLIGRLAQRRFFDDAIIDGQPFPPGSPAEIDQRVLTNTAEQSLLALLIWPGTGYLAGNAGLVVVLSAGFVIAGLAFWIGYHAAPPLRAFGFAASFYPTVLAALWALSLWLG